MPTTEDFREQLAKELASAAAAKSDYLDVRSGDLHERVGGYPRRSHRMRACCRAMWAERRDDDVVLSQPPSGEGAYLVIRYKLPR